MRLGSFAGVGCYVGFQASLNAPSRVCLQVCSAAVLYLLETKNIIRFLNGHVLAVIKLLLNLLIWNPSWRKMFGESIVLLYAQYASIL